MIIIVIIINIIIIIIIIIIITIIILAIIIIVILTVEFDELLLRCLETRLHVVRRTFSNLLVKLVCVRFFFLPERLKK